jgi:hypothetical protein
MNPRLLRPRASSGLIGGLDADARTYITAVRNADGQFMEPAVQTAINNFITGCKSDGIWTAIKASCILMGARTLSGALTPLVGSSPTNNNFVSGDYDRKTGLVGNGSSKHLDTNRASNADAQNDFSMGAWVAAIGASTNHCIIGSGVGASIGSTQILMQRSPTVANDRILARNRNSDAAGTLAQIVNVTLAAGFYGTSRAASGSFAGRYAGTAATESLTSGAPDATTHYVFNRNGANAYSTARIAFYWVGSSLTLASLGSRVSTLYTAIGAAI